MVHWLYTEGFLQAPLELTEVHFRGSNNEEITKQVPIGLALTDKGKNASKNWKGGENGRWEIPLATKKLVEVTGITTESFMGINVKKAEYAFVYTLTGLGVELFKSEGIPAMKGVGYQTKSIGPGLWDGIAMPSDIVRFVPNKTYTQTASFQLYDDGWRLEQALNPLQ
jgi:hypothetical protein